MPVELPTAVKAAAVWKSASLAGAGKPIGELAAGTTDNVVGIGTDVIAVISQASAAPTVAAQKVLTVADKAALSPVATALDAVRELLPAALDQAADTAVR